MWYAAHLIVAMRLKEAETGSRLVWENVILVQADTPEEAMNKVQPYGKLSEGDDDGTLTLDGRPAVAEYLGVRKLIECRHYEHYLCDPTDGTEVTYSTFRVKKDDLSRLVDGDSVDVEYLE
jgi:hypothetical protein